MPGRGPRPAPDSPGWVTGAYQRWGFPCDDCQRLARHDGTTVTPDQFCEHCLAARTAYLKERRQNLVRHKGPVPVATVQPDELAALAGLLEGLQDLDPGEAMQRLADVASRLDPHLLTLRLASALQRAGLVPPFKRRGPQRR